MDLVAKSSKRFFVANMEAKDFISLQPLQDYYVKAVRRNPDNAVDEV